MSIAGPEVRALAGRLRRAQSHLRALGIEIAFKREGHTGMRMISIIRSTETSASSANPTPMSQRDGADGLFT
jgi:hypothetical protein